MKLKFNNDMFYYDRVMNFVSRSWNFKKKTNVKYLFKNKKIYNAVHNFGVPSFEYGAVDLIKKVFPHSRNFTFLKEPLRRSDVLETDIKEISIYEKRKPFNVDRIDVLKEVFLYINSRLRSASKFISIRDAIETLPKNTSAGFPEYGKKGNEKTVKATYARIYKLLSMDSFFEMYRYMSKFPTTIFHRFTPKMKAVKNTYNPNFKIRQIFGAPFFIVALEKLVFHNFVETYKNAFSEFYMVGSTKSEISNSIRKLRNKARFNNKVILCGDISGNDKSISSTHSSLYFQIAYNFIKEEHINAFYAIMTYYIRTPILYANGLTYSNGCTITGSWITSSFTSLVVQIGVLYSYYKLYGKFPEVNEYLFMGDDFVIALEKEEDQFKFKQYMLELNLRLRLDLSEVVSPEQDIEFLGFFWNVYNEPDQTDDWIISKILYPEKFIIFEGKYRLLYRILSIILNLRRYRSLYNRFYNYDPYLRDLVMENKGSFTLFDANNNFINVNLKLDVFFNTGWRML